MRFVRRNGSLVEFSAGALDALNGMRQVDQDAPESGGVLLGRMIVDTDHVVVDEVTTPGLRDVQTRYSFRRSRDSAQLRVTQAWHETGSTRIYLGEWHSHPEDDPAPSAVDRRDWSRVLKEAVYEQDFLLFAIVGRRSIRLWEGFRERSGRTSVYACPLA